MLLGNVLCLLQTDMVRLSVTVAPSNELPEDRPDPNDTCDLNTRYNSLSLAKQRTLLNNDFDSVLRYWGFACSLVTNSVAFGVQEIYPFQKGTLGSPILLAKELDQDFNKRNICTNFIKIRQNIQSVKSSNINKVLKKCLKRDLESGLALNSWSWANGLNIKYLIFSKEIP